MRAVIAVILLSTMLAPIARAECPGQLPDDPRTREIVDCINYLLTRLGAAEGGPPAGQILAPHQTTVSGVRATVVSAGKSGQNLTVALTVENVTDTDVGIVLIGPEPLAILGGAEYEFKSFSGAFQCNNLATSYSGSCMTFGGSNLSILPNNYTRLTPGSKTSLTYVFRTRDKNPMGKIASFSSTFSLLRYQGMNQPTVTSLGIGIPGIDITSFQ